MADILSQGEVDLLLSAVKNGEVEVAGPEHHPGKAAEPQEVFAYDFRRPERVSKEQLKGLQSLFDAFAREMSIAMPPFLRTVIRVDLISIDQLTYDEFILSVTRPTCLAVVDMSPLEGNAVIEMSPALVFPIVDRILGGKGTGLATPRELTEIENRIVHRILLMFLNCLRQSWNTLIEFKLSILAQESDPLIVQIVAGSEMVILVGYELHVGEAVGTMNVCVPLMVLNPVLDQISQQTRFIRRMPQELASRVRNQIVKTVRKIRVPLDAVFGEARLPLSEVARLQKGDVVQLDSVVDGPITVEVGGVRRFLAKPGRKGEHSAIQLTALLREEE